MKRKSLTFQGRQNVYGYLFILPWILGFLIFTLYPIVHSLYLSFHKVRITAFGLEEIFIGLDNYRRAFAVDRVMFIHLQKFLRESILMIIVINVFALIFAMILNKNIKGRGFFRVIFFLPVVVASGPVISELVNKRLLVIPGIENIQIIRILSEAFGQRFGSQIVKMFSQLIYMFWFSGVQILVFLAVLQKIPHEIYEASDIDGASGWEKFWKITLPALKPTILINLIYTFIMLATFDDNAVIKEIKGKMLSVMEGEGYGYASAQAWIYFITLLLTVGIIFLIFTIRWKKAPKASFYTEGFVYNTTRYEYKETFLNTNPYGIKLKKKMLGTAERDGLIQQVFIYLLIIVVAFAFLYPFVAMALKSFQSPDDVSDPFVGLIPSGWYVDNFKQALRTVDFWNALKESLKFSTIPALMQTVAAAVIGYGFSRFNFRGKNILLVLVVATFIIPPQVTMIPTYIFYVNLGRKLTQIASFIGINKPLSILNSVLAFALPASLGQGLRSAIFILLFYQSFNMVPRVLDEAAEIDGAGPLRIFLRISLPLVVPTIIVVFLFSFVWYWNETYLTNLYIKNAKTLPIQLSRFAESFRSIYQNPDPNMRPDEGTDQLNEAIYMAGTLVSILPLLFIYFIFQRWFVQGIERSGIAGE